MTEIVEITETPAPAKPKTKRKVKKVRAKRAPAAVKPVATKTDDLEGLTATSCCDACLDNLVVAQKAQHRLNELEMMYPRQLARSLIHPVTGWRMPAATVMETDDEYLARNPQIAAEFLEMGKAVLGKCHISGGAGCAHPYKGGLSPKLQRDPRAVARYNKARKRLMHQKIELRD